MRRSWPELSAAAAQRLAGLLWQHLAKLADVATWADELDRAEQDLAAARAAAAEAGAEACDAAARLAALRAAVGATADELRRRLEAVRKRIAELSAERKTLDSRHREIAEQRARLQGREEQLQANMAAEAQRRDAAVAAFQCFAATGLMAVAAADLELPDTGRVGQRLASDLRAAVQALVGVVPDLAGDRARLAERRRGSARRGGGERPQRSAGLLRGHPVGGLPPAAEPGPAAVLARGFRLDRAADDGGSDRPVRRAAVADELGRVPGGAR